MSSGTMDSGAPDFAGWNLIGEFLGKVGCLGITCQSLGPGEGVPREALPITDAGGVTGRARRAQKLPTI